jgi:hypothetical protein
VVFSGSQEKTDPAGSIGIADELTTRWRAVALVDYLY